MRMIKTVETQIRRVEGFDVEFLNPDGRRTRIDKRGIPSYDYKRAAKATWTVAVWKQERFGRSHSGWECRVLMGSGEEAHGNTLLRNVRASYG